MNESIIDLIISVILSTGLVGVFLKVFVLEKLKASIKNDYDHKIEAFKAHINSEYDIKLETFRGDINRNTILLGVVSSAQKEAYNAYNLERAGAIKGYWSYYVDLTSDMHSIIQVDRTIYKEEHKSVIEEFGPNAFIYEILASVEKPNVWKANNRMVEVKKLHPFLSTELLTLIEVLDYFFGRICFLYANNYKEGKLEHWSYDGQAITNLSQIVTPEELKFLTTLERGSLLGVKAVVELKILAEIYKITHGKSGAEYSFEHAKHIIESLKVSAT